MKSEKVTIKSNIGNIVGVLEAPEKVMHKDKAVLILHGRDGSKDSKAHEKAKAFNDAGFVTLRIDMFGSGESDGDWAEHTITTGIESIKAASEHLVSLGYENIVIFGTSYSGFCAICAAPEIDALESMILRSTTPDYAEKNRNEFDEKFINEWKKKGRYEHRNGRKVNYSFYEDCLKYNGYEIAKDISVPVLILHAALDTKASMESIKKLKDNIGQSILVVYDDAEHGLSDEKSFDDVLKRAVAFCS